MGSSCHTNVSVVGIIVVQIIIDIGSNGLYSIPLFFKSLDLAL